MTTPQVKTGLFVGLNKGHVVTRRELAPRPRARKGVCFSFLVHSLDYSFVQIVPGNIVSDFVAGFMI